MRDKCHDSRVDLSVVLSVSVIVPDDTNPITESDGCIQPWVCSMKCHLQALSHETNVQNGKDCDNNLRPFQVLSVFRITSASQNLSVSQGNEKKTYQSG